MKLTISKDVFANATANSTLKFTVTNNTGVWSQIYIHKVLNQWQHEDLATVYDGSGWTGDNTFTFTIGNYLNTFKDNDICIVGSQSVIVTKIELIP